MRPRRVPQSGTVSGPISAKLPLSGRKTSTIAALPPIAAQIRIEIALPTLHKVKKGGLNAVNFKSLIPIVAIVLACSQFPVPAFAASGQSSSSPSSSSTLSASALAPAVEDTFSRTSIGWAVSSSGVPYTFVFGEQAASVRSGVGILALAPGAGAQASLASVQVADATAEVSIAAGALPSRGNGAYFGPMLRTTGTNGYRLAARVTTGGKVDVSVQRVSGSPSVSVNLASKSSALTVAAGQKIRLRLSTSGSSPVQVSGSAAVTGTSQSTTLSTSDTSSGRIAASGAPALWGYVSGSSNPTELRYDDLAVAANSTTTLPQPPAPMGPPASTGSLPIGAASYPVPSNAVFVSPLGADSATGTISAPKRSVGMAVASAPAGGTVVLRAGLYNETVVVPRGKRLTIQNYPNEAAWLDGSSSATGFAQSGSTWIKNGWMSQFDSSPTQVRGGADGTALGWRWINPAHPMAAHPDQVWIDGAAQEQVGSLSQVRPGAFFADYGARRLVLGSNPTGKQVYASTRQVALTVLSPGSVIRGIGVRRYAPSVPDFGAVKFYDASGATLENVVISQNATQGLQVDSKSVTLRRVTATENGQIGLGANRADSLTIDRVFVERNNRELFNAAPGAGGSKVTNTRGVNVTNSLFSDNFASGLWFDMGTSNVNVVASEFVNNKTEGLIIELAGTVKAVNNLIAGNGEVGLLVLDSSEVRLWNNSIRGSFLPVRIADGPRNFSAIGVTGIMRNIEFENNVIGAPRVGSNWCGLVCVLDDRRISTAAQMNVRADGNVYYRASGSSVPTSIMRWAAGAGSADYATIGAFRTATGQESRGSYVDPSAVQLSGSLPRDTTIRGVAIPSDIGSLAGISGSIPGAVR